MKSLFKKLLSTQNSPQVIDASLLVFRVAVGLSIINTHGWNKLVDFEGNAAHIPDPFGLGGATNVVIAIVADIVFAGFVVAGFLTRFSALVVLQVTLVGLLVVHINDPWKVKDVPLMYSLAFSLIMVLGAGKYSIDHWLFHSKK